MPEYRPQQRKVSARIFTEVGWITGTFHCSLRQSLVEFLNAQQSFYRITDVRLPGAEQPMPFFALQRRRVILVSPGETEENLEKSLAAESIDYQVSCVLADGVVAGRLRTAARLRLSDHLVNHNGFFVLRDCVLRGRGHSQGAAKRLPVAVVNDRAVIGVSEDDPRSK